MKQIFLGILLFFSISVESYAGEKLIIVRGQDFEPYHYIGPNGNETGFIIDIVRSVAGAIDIKVTFKQYPWSRCLKLVKIGHVDAMMNLFKTSERVEFLYFSDNILTYEINRFFKLKSTVVENYEDMTGLASFKIGAIRNYSYGKAFDNTNFLRIFRLETEKALLKSLVNKRSDVIVGNEIVLNRLIQQSGMKDEIDVLPMIVSNDPLYIGFSKVKGHKEIADRFSIALAEFKKTNTYKDILRKYGLLKVQN